MQQIIVVALQIKTTQPTSINEWMKERMNEREKVKEWMNSIINTYWIEITEKMWLKDKLISVVENKNLQKKKRMAVFQCKLKLCIICIVVCCEKELEIELVIQKWARPQTKHHFLNILNSWKLV